MALVEKKTEKLNLQLELIARELIEQRIEDLSLTSCFVWWIHLLFKDFIRKDDELL